MIETVLAALIAAKIRHYKLKYLFMSWTFYPIIALEIILFFFQTNTFLSNYFYVIHFDRYFKTIYILAYLVPILYFKLYKQSLIGSASVLVGTLLNRFVMAQNGGKMPVFPTLSYLTGYLKPYTFDQVNDYHVFGDASSRFKILCDYIDVGYNVMSPGDLFIHFFVFIIIYSAIKELNLKHKEEFVKAG